MDTKQMLEKAITHVIKQGKASKNPESSICQYRSKCGLMCAVGALIPDELYSEEFEGRSVHDREIRDIMSSVAGRELSFEEIENLNRVQKSHDNASHLKEFVEAFIKEIKYAVYEGDLPEYCLEFIN